MSWSYVCFLCLESLKLPFMMQAMSSLTLWPSALKCNSSDRGILCVIVYVWLLTRYLNLPPVSPIYCASGHFLKRNKYTTLVESQLWLPGFIALWRMNTLVTVLMCLQTLHLYLLHALLHSGSSSVIVFQTRSCRWLGGCLKAYFGAWTQIPPILPSHSKIRFNAMDEMIDFRTEFSD